MTVKQNKNTLNIKVLFVFSYCVNLSYPVSITDLLEEKKVSVKEQVAA